MYRVKRKTHAGWEQVPGMTFANRLHADEWVRAAIRLDIPGVLAYKVETINAVR